MPQLPQDQSKAVGVHLQGLRLDLVAGFQGFRRGPDRSNSVVEEHVAVDHKVVSFEVADTYLYLKMPIFLLFDINKNVVRC